MESLHTPLRLNYRRCMYIAYLRESGPPFSFLSVLHVVYMLWFHHTKCFNSVSPVEIDSSVEWMGSFLALILFAFCNVINKLISPRRGCCDCHVVSLPGYALFIFTIHDSFFVFLQLSGGCCALCAVVVVLVKKRENDGYKKLLRFIPSLRAILQLYQREGRMIA